MGVTPDKSFEKKEKDLEIPSTIRDEVEAANWAMKRGASPGSLVDYLDDWKERVRPKVEKKKVVTTTIKKEEVPKETTTKIEKKIEEVVKPVKKTSFTKKLS